MVRIGIVLLVLGALSGALAGCHAEGDVSKPQGSATSFMR